MHRALVGALGLALFSATAAAQDVKAEKQQAFQQAQFSTAGTVEQAASGDRIVIKPYDGTSTTFTIPAGTPVFQGSGKITTAGLRPGVDVRAHYKQLPDRQEIVAVEVLTPQQAAEAAKQPFQVTAPAAVAETMTPEELEKAREKASGSQAGRIKSLGGDRLVLDPYQQAAGDATLSIAAETPIFKGQERLSTTDVKPGADVRVLFEEHEGAAPSVVALEVLDPTVARALEKAERDVPKSE